MRKEQTAPPLYGAGLRGGRRGGALREGGSRRGGIRSGVFCGGRHTVVRRACRFFESGQRLFIGKDGRLLSLEKNRAIFKNPLQFASASDTI